MTSKEKLKELLKELFRFGDSDLDFGIPRIMNKKREDMTKFIEDDLDLYLQEELSDLKNKKIRKIEDQIDEIIEYSRKLGENYTKKDSYKRKKRELDNAEHIIDNIENEIFNLIYTFFNRYYDNGDFISQKRYSSKNKYAIPYNGEEVFLHWANKDQFYVKTSEEFDKYSFKHNNIKVIFTVDNAEIEKNNNESEQKRFFVLTDDFFNYKHSKNVVEIEFEYRVLSKQEEKKYSTKNRQDDIRKNIFKEISNFIEKNNLYFLNHIVEKKAHNSEKKVLDYHLYRFTKKNESDYFIHKDLRSFLYQELEFYIKNEIIDFNSLIQQEEKDIDKYFLKIKIFKNISNKIIDFLAQIEDFQKKLFTKRKFVIDNEYCMTLDKVPKNVRENLFENIINNKKQLEEWKKLYYEDISSLNDLYDGDELKNLVLDTKYFDISFKEKLLNSIDNIDEKINGLMINSENYQALNLIKEKYKNKIDTIYIDPPYNTKSNPIVYKNNYKHSSWLSLMNDRLELSKKELLKDEGVTIIAIDNAEQEKLGLLLDQVYGDTYKKDIVVVRHNPRGAQSKNISYKHEYAYFLYPDKDKQFIGVKKRKEADERNLRDSGTESDRTDAKTCFYPFIIKDKEIIDIGKVPKEDFHPESSNIKKGDKYEVWPIDTSNDEKKWRYSRESVEDILNKLEVRETNSGLNIYFIKDTEPFNTLLTDSRYDASEYGTKVLQNILGKEKSGKFSYPKSLHNVRDCLLSTVKDNKEAYVLDYFAGSGTTAHALLDINSEDNGERTYIIVEMGKYFEDVTKTRIKKLMYSKKWEDNKPKNIGGYSHIFKYQRLEQYEDVLENIEFNSKEGQTDIFSLYDDYFIKYMLDYETKESILDLDKFNKPFEYKTKIFIDKEEVPKDLDLVETFNYLIGMQIKNINIKDLLGRKYYIVSGKCKNNETLIIWRDTENLNIEKDKKIIEEKIITNKKYDQIFINGDNYVPNAILIEDVFNEKMFE